MTGLNGTSEETRMLEPSMQPTLKVLDNEVEGLRRLDHDSADLIVFPPPRTFILCSPERATGQSPVFGIGRLPAHIETLLRQTSQATAPEQLSGVFS
jgi:hypothetical protein